MQPMQQQNDPNQWNNRDDVSFEDSERFEEDSQVSLDDSIDGNQQNWRGWTDCRSNCEAIQPGLSCVVYQYNNPSGRFSSASTRTVVQADPSNPLSQHPMMTRGDNPAGTLLTLSEISARVCAEKWSFQQLEEMYAHICETRAAQMADPPPATTIPEKIFLSFIVHCFPQSTDEIRMYSTLANGSSEQYEFGKTLYEWGNVRDVSQTGFLLSGNISNSSPPDGRPGGVLNEQEDYHVTVKVDRCRIVECTCECSNRSSWCKHVVALCIYRISKRNQIKFNETIADAINAMSDYDLRRLVQWHINEIPRKCIPGFQKLIDLIKDPNSTINNLHGAPDPTDGGNEPVSRFDFPEIENKIRRLLCKYCVPSPSIHCDVQCLSTNHHPMHIEWTTLIKPLRCREPEGMWNLLQMVREMFARGDENAVALLRTVTDECLSNNQVLLWWYISKLVQSGQWVQNISYKLPLTQQVLSQLNCSELCDEVVILWKLVAINPRAGKFYRSQLATYLQDYHRTAVNRLKGMITMAHPMIGEVNPKTDATVLSNHQTATILETIENCDLRYPLSAQNMKFDLNCFPGFYSAIQMCHYLNEQDIRFGVRDDAVFYVAAPNLTTMYKLVPPAREKILKKKKKKKKEMKKRQEVEGSRREHLRMDEFQGVDGIWRMHPDVQADPANDSTESGQESDVQKIPQRVEIPRKKKIDSVEMDVNEVLAAAFSPLDALESRFLRVEAYGTHGYRADAIDYALKVVEYLIDSLTEQSHEYERDDEGDNLPSTSKPSSFSSASSATSDEVTAADREEEVARGNKFLSTMEKILYITKVFRDSPHLQRTVFDVSMRTLAIVKYPLFTKHQQIALSYYETEFVAILDQLWQTVPMGELQLDQIRTRAEELVASEAGNNGELPPIAFTKFLFLALYWTEPTGPVRAGPNASTASLVLQQHRRLLRPTDSDLALHCALSIIGCRPMISDKYIMHWETIRREKSELTSMLLVRYKDSQEKCSLIIDRILDPKMHRMYQNHLSNAAYFLERCAVYKKRFKSGQRPVFPYKETEKGEVEKKEDPLADYEAQLVAELQRMANDPIPDPDAALKARIVEEGMQSSSSSSVSGYTDHNSGCSTSRSIESFDSDPASNMPGMTAENREKAGEIQRINIPRWRKLKKRVHSIYFDPRNMVTDAHVYHMQELSKKILFEAGGQQSPVLWGNPVVGGTNRRLHLAAIVIAVYALGMSNRISPSWNTRTYSNIASWVASQVQEVGPQALEVIREIWMAHFTPNEIANISERAAPATDPQMKREAAKLALSVLPFAHALSDDEVINAMGKCRVDGRDTLIAGLLAMDTTQFRQIGRARTLFAAMQHWHDLSYDEEQRNQQPPPPPPAGMVVNPYANIIRAAIAPQAAAQNNQQAPPQAAYYLYPQAYGVPKSDLVASASYRNEVAARMHQSHSAPQLGGNPTGEVAAEDHIAAPLPAPNHQNLPQPSPTNALLNAYHYGMRGMDCMATSPGEERHMYLKFGPNPPYSDELKCLYSVAKQLGGNYLLCFYTNASRSVISPYILHHYAAESTQYFPPRNYQQQQQQPPRQPSGPVPLMQPSPIPMPLQTLANVRYPNIKCCSHPGQITNAFISHGYQQITGELFERCCEQYLQAIVNKLNSPRINECSDVTVQICNFIQSAHGAFKWIPSLGRPLFDDFVRSFKRQKSFKKDCAIAVNNLLAQLSC